MEAKFNSVQTYTYHIDIRPDYAPVHTVYCIPEGTVLTGGQTLIIANNAQDHTEANPYSFDLSEADFEWYDVSTNSTVDIDNPYVDNLDIWYTYSLSIWVLHDRGFCGYAIAMPPAGLTKEEFLANYKWEGTYIAHTLAGDFERFISKAYKVPNDWVIDAVNLSIPTEFHTLSFDTSLDAGYAYCGMVNSDPDRYGKSVKRKKIGTRLIDTNNSSNDFISNTTPSLREE